MSLIPAQMQVGQSVEKLMDELVELERTVHPDLHIYRWQRPTMEFPCLTNWLEDSPFDWRDQITGRDTVVIAARVFVGVNEDDMDRLGMYADAFRAVVDPALYQKKPLNGHGGLRAMRQSMRQISLPLSEGIASVAFEFPLAFELYRRIIPNS